jgi:hypothetical protein
MSGQYVAEVTVKVDKLIVIGWLTKYDAERNLVKHNVLNQAEIEWATGEHVFCPCTGIRVTNLGDGFLLRGFEMSEKEIAPDLLDFLQLHVAGQPYAPVFHFSDRPEVGKVEKNKVSVEDYM